MYNFNVYGQAAKITPEAGERKAPFFKNFFLPTVNNLFQEKLMDAYTQDPRFLKLYAYAKTCFQYF